MWGRWMETRESQSTVCCAPGGCTGRNAGGRDLGAILQWTGSHEYTEVAPAESPPAQTREVLGQACLAFAFQTLYNPTQPPSSLHCPLHVYNTFLVGPLFCFNKLLHMKNLEQGLQLVCSAIPSPQPLLPLSHGCPELCPLMWS